MPGELRSRSPEDWQELIVRCLSIRYPVGEFITIPDTVRGDCGLEGFTRDGKGFQCYAAEEPLTAAELTKKQKAKITRDLAKLSEHKETLAVLFGPTVLTCWILVVPRWEDKALLAHAELKAQLLRRSGIPFISNSMVPSIVTAEHFSLERQKLVRVDGESLRIESVETLEGAVQDWVADNDELVANAERKAKAICHGNNENSRKLRDEIVRHYLSGQNTLDKFRIEYPELFEAVAKIKKDKEHFLVTESLVPMSLPPQRWKDEIRNMQEDFRKAMPGLSAFNIQQLAHEAVADWLLRCPLDFPEAN